MKTLKYFLYAITLLVLLAFIIKNNIEGSPINKTNNKINGVSFVAPSTEPVGNPFIPVKEINANWVCVMPYAFNKAGTSKVYFDVSRQWWGEKSEGTIATIKMAHNNGLKVMLKPHVWVMGQGWTGDFTLNSESEWQEWEKGYAEYIMNHAKIADSLNVAIFCIGLEYRKVIKERPAFWVKLIEKVRKVYHGKLTYAANWDNYLNIPFWDKLDYISIDAYFPLSEKDTASVNELIKAWDKPYNKIKKLQLKYKKPILFAEYGYRSINKAAGKQWELPEHYHYNGPSNMEIQKNALEAIYKKFWKQPWFAGGFLWKWFDYHERAGGQKHSGYTPQNKPSEEVIKKYFDQ